MTEDLHRADPSLQRALARLRILLPAAVIIVGAGAWWLFRRTSNVDELSALLSIFLGVAVVVASTALALAWSLWQEARLIVREDCFPASDMRTLNDVPIRHGAGAKAIAKHFWRGAIAAALAGLAVVIWALWFVTALM